MYVEKTLETCGFPYENRQMFFFIRGAYPFYTLSNLFLFTYFYFMTPKDYKEDWEMFYYVTFILKFLISFYLAYKKTSFV